MSTHFFWGEELTSLFNVSQSCSYKVLFLIWQEPLSLWAYTGLMFDTSTAQKFYATSRGSPKQWWGECRLRVRHLPHRLDCSSLLPWQSVQHLADLWLCQCTEIEQYIGERWYILSRVNCWNCYSSVPSHKQRWHCSHSPTRTMKLYYQ